MGKKRSKILHSIVHWATQCSWVDNLFLQASAVQSFGCSRKFLPSLLTSRIISKNTTRSEVLCLAGPLGDCFFDALIHDCLINRQKTLALMCTIFEQAESLGLELVARKKFHLALIECLKDMVCRDLCPPPPEFFVPRHLGGAWSG